MLQVVGAAHLAADGDHGMVVAMLLALLDEHGKTTPMGLLKTAKEKAPWAACLFRDRSPAARVRRVRGGFRASVDRGDWSLADLEDHQADVARAIARTRRREARAGVPTIIDGAPSGRGPFRRGPERGAKSDEVRVAGGAFGARPPNSSRDENWS